MRLIILIATLALALPFVISQTAMPMGTAVSERFLERPTRAKPQRYTVPSNAPEGPILSAATLADWVKGQTGPSNGYAWRVIPLDVLYLLCLGVFLGVASTNLAGMIRWPSIVGRSQLRDSAASFSEPLLERGA